MEAIVLGNGEPNHVKIIEILLAAGADPIIPDKHGILALEHARKRGFKDIVQRLESHQLDSLKSSDQ